MHKIKVNNQVVSMRKFVKQAKIRAINKCTKQIKFFENRKGNEEQIAKTKRKHQRLLEEVKLLKKIKPDSVSKLALSKAKDWKAVLAEKNVPLEERCFAILANYPPVQEAVEKFHKDNSELIVKIPELVKQWEGKKSRSSQIYKKNQKGNQNNATGPNSLPIGNKNNFHKSREAQIKRQSTESLESLPDNSDLKSVQSEENLVTKEATKMKRESDNLDPTSILSGSAKNKSLVVDDEKSDASDNSLSDSSDFANHQNSKIKEKLPDESKTKYDKFDKNLKQSKACAVNNQSNLTEKVALKKEAVDSNDNIETKIKPEEEQVGKSQDIVSKLLAISKLKTKGQNKPKNKASTAYQRSNAQTDSDDGNSSDVVKKLYDSAKKVPSFSTKPGVRNKMKAVTMLDLNELQDVDEIPIEKSDSDGEDESDEDPGKQKKDPFFLCNGEPVSESDEDENPGKEIAKKRDFSPFKKKPYGDFRGQKDNSFQKRKFEKHSENERNANFRENSFMNNRKEFSFKDNKQNFKRTFDDNSDSRPNKNFKFVSKGKFSSRNGTNNFTKNPKENSFSQNHREGKRNSYPSKSNLSQSSKKVIDKADDKPLHPSWEAKRKLKEAANTKFQGKRMVFKD